ncbi:MAG: sugar transferase [Aliidongia sp.]
MPKLRWPAPLATDPEARREWQRDFKLRKDPRVTSLGRFLRKSSLDELPQLFSVVTGEMSLIGPRPIVADEIARYGAGFSDYAACRPGITGLWQVSGRNDVDYSERVEIDSRYARNWTLVGDISILFRTVSVVLRRDGAY